MLPPQRFVKERLRTHWHAEATGVMPTTPHTHTYHEILRRVRRPIQRVNEHYRERCGLHHSCERVGTESGQEVCGDCHLCVPDVVDDVPRARLQTRRAALCTTWTTRSLQTETACRQPAASRESQGRPRISLKANTAAIPAKTGLVLRNARQRLNTQQLEHGRTTCSARVVGNRDVDIAPGAFLENPEADGKAGVDGEEERLRPVEPRHKVVN